MKKNEITRAPAWLQGYHPNQAPPARRKGAKTHHVLAGYQSPVCIPNRQYVRKGAKDHHVLAGYQPPVCVPNRQYMLTLILGFLLFVSGTWVFAQQMVASAARQRADMDLRNVYYAAADREAVKALAVTAPKAPLPTVKPKASPTTAKPLQGTAQPPRTFVTPMPMLTYATRDRFLPLISLNRDIVGWLTIPDVLDLPVVQRDNTYYLTHNFQGVTSYSGTLFLDQDFSIVPPLENLLIHGHNMRDGSMFGALLNYRAKGFYTKHWLIQFETLYENGSYVVFAAFDMVNELSNAAFFPYSYAKFDTDVQFNDFIAGVKERSLFQNDLSVLPTDSLLTLSTCAGGSDHYLVIVARKIRADESQASLTPICLMSAF